MAPRATASASPPPPAQTNRWSGQASSISHTNVCTPLIPIGLCRNALICNCASACSARRRSPAKTAAVAAGSRPKPRTRNSSAPYASICRSLSAGAVSTIAMRQRIPATAQYAASDAPVLPLEVATHIVLPRARMSATAAAANRSLYEPVGLTDSSLNHSSDSPHFGPIATDFTSGVFPSPRVIRAEDGIGGNQSAHRQTPLMHPELAVPCEWNL